jgi:hypothetical protein
MTDEAIEVTPFELVYGQAETFKDFTPTPVDADAPDPKDESAPGVVDSPAQVSTTPESGANLATALSAPPPLDPSEVPKLQSSSGESPGKKKQPAPVPLPPTGSSPASPATPPTPSSPNEEKTTP